MPVVFLGSPGPVFQDPNQQAVQANATLTATGSLVLTGYGVAEVTLFINVKAAPTGTTPTLQYTLQEVDPGDGTTVIGSTVSSTVINAIGIQKITLFSTSGGSIKVSWVVTGTTPSFTQVYATLVGKAGTIKVNDGVNTATVKGASTAAVAADPALVTALSPNSPTPVGPDTVGAAGILNALNAAASVALAGQRSFAMQLAAGTLIGTIVAEISYDGGTNWITTNFDDSATGDKSTSIVFSSSNPATGRTIIGAGGASHARVRVSAFTSGTASCTLRATATDDPTLLASGKPGSSIPPDALQVGGTDGSVLRAWMTDTRGIGVVDDTSFAVAVGRQAGSVGHRIGFSSGAGTPQPLRATTYTEPAAAAQRSVSSSSALDTAAGTGARQVKITYYDATMAGPLTETVNLNGVTAVATVATNIKFIESIEVVSVGTLGANQGTITLFVNNAGAGGTIGTIGVGNRVAAIGDNQTFWAHHYVAAGKTCLLLGMSAVMTGVTSGVTYGAAKDPTVATSPETVRTPMLGTRQAMTTYPYRAPIVIAGPSRFVMYNNLPGGNECDGSFEFVEF